MKTTGTLRLALLVASFVIRHSSFVIAQGPLTPPGAPAPTMKTLEQIEPRTPISSLPFTISAKGAYYVTDTLTGVPGQHGITISADHVTLDLGGFELIGAGGGAATSGIRITSGRINNTIRNGTVRGWLGSGVIAEAATCTETRVENLRVFSNGGAGIALGDNGTAKGCEVRGNGGAGISGGTLCKIIECTATGQTGGAGDGILVGARSIVATCVVAGNASDGLQTGTDCVVTGCTSASNTASGFNLGARVAMRDCTADANGTHGISGSAHASLAHCTATNNGSDGFHFTEGCTLEGCVAADNAGEGFELLDAAVLRGCNAFSNTGAGIAVDDGAVITECSVRFNGGAAGISGSIACTIIGCTVRLNTSSAVVSAGITTSTAGLISRCVVNGTASTAGALTASTGMGINVGAASTVEHCTVQNNTGDGIRVTSNCVVLGNTCNGNGSGTGDGAGIHSTSTDNRIEANSVTVNERGIDVDSNDSLILRNSAAGNATNYEIAGGNHYGAIVDLTGSGSGAVSGNSAASSLGSTDPWANYSH